MDTQVNNMCKKAYFNIRNISKLRRSLDRDTLKSVVNSLVTPHLDYGNGLLYGISSKLLQKLQVAQNSAVRLIEGTRKCDPVTELRKNLHWLPIEARVKYKILTTTWKTLYNLAPEYLEDLIAVRNSGQRTTTREMLEIPDAQGCNNQCDRAYYRVAPNLWNELKLEVKKATTLSSFKKKLKTHLFKESYK